MAVNEANSDELIADYLRELRVSAWNRGLPSAQSDVLVNEVRSARSGAFGAPEERVDSAKVGHMYRAALAFARSAEARELGVSGFPLRVDLVVVDLRKSDPAVRHFVRLEPA